MIDFGQNLEGMVYQDGMRIRHHPATTEDEGLIIASGNSLYACGEKQKYKLFTSPLGTINAVAATGAGPALCYAADNRACVMRPTTDFIVKTEVAKRAGTILALMNGNLLYDAGGYPGVYETVANTKAFDMSEGVQHMARRGHLIYCFCGMDKTYVYNTAKNSSGENATIEAADDIYFATPVATEPEEEVFLCQIKGDKTIVLHTPGGSGSLKEIATRWTNWLVLHAANNTLYDANYNVFDTLNDPEGLKPLFIFDKQVTSMTSLPADEWEKYARIGVKE